MQKFSDSFADRFNFDVWQGSYSSDGARQRSLSHRSQSIGMHRKSMDWFQYDSVLRHERAKRN